MNFIKRLFTSREHKSSFNFKSVTVDVGGGTPEIQNDLYLFQGIDTTKIKTIGIMTTNYEILKNVILNVTRNIVDKVIIHSDESTEPLLKSMQIDSKLIGEFFRIHVLPPQNPTLLVLDDNTANWEGCKQILKRAQWVRNYYCIILSNRLLNDNEYVSLFDLIFLDASIPSFQSACYTTLNKWYYEIPHRNEKIIQFASHPDIRIQGDDLEISLLEVTHFMNGIVGKDICNLVLSYCNGNGRGISIQPSKDEIRPLLKAYLL